MGHSMYVERVPDAYQELYRQYRDWDCPNRESIRRQWWDIQTREHLHFHRSYTGFYTWFEKPMSELGMIFDAKFQFPEWPNPSPEVDALIDAGDDDHPLVVEYNRTLDNLILARRFEHPGIPSYKFSSSDDYRVWPDEIRSALRIYQERDGEAFIRRYWTRHDTDADMRYWQEWIAFMRKAETLDGFRVR